MTTEEPRGRPADQTADVPAGEGAPTTPELDLAEFEGHLGPEKPKAGRPTTYTPETAATILERLASGESLRGICAGPDMPDKATVFRWLAKHDEFRDQYAHAREAQADALFDDCLEISDDGTSDYVAKENSDGSTYEAVDHEHISRSKLRVETRKWMVGKLAPKKYGEKVALEHTGKDGAPIELDVTSARDRIAARLDEIARRAAGEAITGGADGGADKPAGGDAQGA